MKGKFEIDALVKTSKTNYIIETKFIRSITPSVILNRGIQQLLLLEEELNLEPVTLVLLVVGSSEAIEKVDVTRFSVKENLRIYKIDDGMLSGSN